MPVVEGYISSEVGECSVTADIGEGPFVRSPYMISRQMVGKPFTMGAPMIRAFASALDLREGESVDEELDRKDQEIEDLKTAVEVLAEELKMAKPAAERWWILEGQKDGTDYETQIAELKETVAKKDKQLQQLNRGGRPQKAAA